MNPAKELNTIEPQALQQVPSQSGLSPMVQAVMRGELTPEALSQLLQIQKDYEADVARKAFHKAVAEFKSAVPTVSKDKINKQYDSPYTSLENMVNTVNPHLSEFRLNAHWEIDQTSGIKVTCVLSHELGHSESTSMTAPPDTSGQKNPIQQIKSTITYLKLATYESIIGVASREGSKSDDGNGAGTQQQPPDQPDRQEDHATRLRLAKEQYADAIIVIKENLGAGGEMRIAAETWYLLSNEAKQALWVAPTKGGPFTTQERETIRSPDFHQSYYGSKGK